MLSDVKGTTALVTGAGSGINLELAKKFLAGGCNVMIADLALRPEAKEAMSSAPAHGARAEFVETDVTNWSSLENAFEQTLKTFGHLNIVVPGAGVFDPAYSNFWHFNTPTTADTNKTSSYKTLDINVTHPTRATQLAIDHFLRQKQGGVVCHISSIAAQMNALPLPLYTMSKHAISCLVRSLAPLEESHDIRVVAVAPGIVKTPLWLEQAEKLAWADDAKDTWIPPERIADVMVDLITNPAHVGGTVLEVGAETIRPVQELNDPGPSGTGHTLEHMANAFGEAYQLMGENYGKQRPQVAA